MISAAAVGSVELLTQMMSSHRRLGAGGWVSLLWSLLVFISVCRGAAVDAPSQTLTVTSEPSIIEPSTTVSPSLIEDSGLKEEGSGETEGDHPRFARSVPGHDSVFDYYDYSAHKSSHLSRNSGPSSRAGQLPVNSLSEPRDPMSRAPTWQLEPQVGKSARGKRVRSGGQSSRYRSREQEPEELLAIENSLDAVERGAATTMLSRQQRNGRRYDVPQIECPRSPDHMERFACPRPDRRGRFRCIDDRALCDGFYDCPDKEDENPDHCLFYKTTKAHLDILAEALLRWARGR